MSSPRSWGCFCPRSRGESDGPRLPHARGGVSIYASGAIVITSSSPRSWGCFRADTHFACVPRVFPTLVGVFLATAIRLLSPLSLPHARGGVSTYVIADWSAIESSPRSWGCFRNEYGGRSTSKSLPHARGGVSGETWFIEVKTESSPRSWGCFWLRSERRWLPLVFPTLVGVFL